MNGQPRRDQSDLRIPEENVLDLRRSGTPSTPVRRPPRADPLASFWRRPPRRPSGPAWPQRVGGAIASAAGRVRVRSSRLHLGAFPFVAAALLMGVGLAGVIGEVFHLRDAVVRSGQQGIAALRVAGASAAARDLPAASAAFTDAAAQFEQAQGAFRELHPVTARLLSILPFVGPRYTSAERLLEAAHELAQAGATFSTLAYPLARDGAGFAEAASLIANLERDGTRLQAVVAQVDRAAKQLEGLQPAYLPAAYRPQLEAIQSALPGLRGTLGIIGDSLDVAQQFFGVDRPREVLFLFQNAHELRPSGGFLGSFALIRMDQGAFHILDAPNRGSLGIDDRLPADVMPPLPLQVITPSWYFRDANWYPDFPTTAQQVIRFYRQARGFVPDGVVALTSGLIERLLAVTGPVEVPGYGVTVDAENFVRLTQEQVELNFDLRVNDPKRFIVDLIPVLASRLAALDLSRYPAALATVLESIRSGDLQLWSADPMTSASLARLGWTGALPSTTGDFLELVDTNVGGGKTDGVIEERIADSLELSADGGAVATVTITRTHHGTAGDPFTGARNRTYHRLYVPLGAKLLDVQGFTRLDPGVFRTLPPTAHPDELLASVEGRTSVDEQSGTRVNDEFGKTVFGNWTELDPGQTVTASFRYLLPFTVGSGLERYDLLVGKQAGANRTVSLEVRAPSRSRIVEATGPNVQRGASTLQAAAVLDRPLTWSFILQQ